MGVIKALDAATILKLAAGEIIDRPVSIVKELVDNAIDAGATCIEIDLLKGGIAQIGVSDNGSGICKDDLPKTIEAHATSKLTHFDDVSTVLTMGFRGEALASIAAVSQLTVHSYHPDDDIGYELTLSPGGTPSIQPKARAIGTTIRVAHLFKKVPVRFRFLKSPSTEAGLIARLIEHVALIYPTIAFTLRHNDVVILNTSGDTDLTQVFSKIVGISIDDVISFSKQAGEIAVSGVMSSPNKTFKSRQKCYFNVNGRMVKVPVFFKAVDNALADIIPRGHFPAISARLDCPTDQVDINCHPKKSEVAFSQPDAVFLAIKRAIQSGIVAPAQSWHTVAPNISSHLQSSESIPRGATNNESASFTPTPTLPSQSLKLPQKSPLYALPHTQPSPSPNTVTQKITTPPSVYRSEATTIPEDAIETPPSPPKWFGIANKYIVFPLDNALFVFDQHAVHERILYDHYNQDMANHVLVTVPLLIPEYVTVSPATIASIESVLPTLKQLGFDIGVFGTNQLVIREVPQLLAQGSLANWFTTWEGDLNDIITLHESEIIKHWQMKACKAAIKSGQRLRDADVDALITNVITSPNQYTCPHGRPLYIRIQESELDRMFLRS